MYDYVWYKYINLTIVLVINLTIDIPIDDTKQVYESWNLPTSRYNFIRSYYFHACPADIQDMYT